MSILLGLLKKHLPSRLSFVCFSLVSTMLLLLISCKNDLVHEYQATVIPSPAPSFEQQGIPVLWQGAITLQIEPDMQGFSSIDLDRVPNSTIDSGIDDLAFVKSRGTITVYTLRPVNASAVVLGAVNVEFDDCVSNLNNLSAGSIPELVSGNVICILTNENRFAKVVIRQAGIENKNKAMIFLDVIVWEKIVK